MTDLTVQDAGMNHERMESDVVVGIQEVLQTKQDPIKKIVTVHEPHEHVAKKVQDTQHQIAVQLQHIRGKRFRPCS